MCISELSEWDYVKPNFNEMLKIALKVNAVPEKNKIYTVNNPFVLFYKRTCYISIDGFNHNIFDESGFAPIKENKNILEKKEKIEKAMIIKN